jgi:hypothetical protein
MPALLSALINQIALNGFAAIAGFAIVGFLLYVGYVLGRAHIFDEDPGSN